MGSVVALKSYYLFTNVCEEKLFENRHECTLIGREAQTYSNFFLRPINEV